MPSPALLKMGPDEDGEEVEVEYSDCEFGVLSFEKSLVRCGRESGSSFGGGVVGRNLTCTRGNVASNNREVPGLSIQLETLQQDDAVYGGSCVESW
jgi:hypothetical protein